MKNTFCRLVFVAFVLLLLATASATCAQASESGFADLIVHLRNSGLRADNCIALPDGNFIIQQEIEKKITTHAAKITPGGEVLWRIDGIYCTSAVALSDGSALLMDSSKTLVRVLNGSVVSKESIPAMNPDADVKCTLLPAMGGYMVCAAERERGKGDTRYIRVGGRGNTAIRYYSEDGTQQWDRVFQDEYLVPRGALPYEDGYLLYGTREVSKDGKLSEHGFAMLLSGDGSIRWNWICEERMNYSSGAVLPDGGLLLFIGTNTNYICYVAVRLDKNGEQVWRQEHTFFDARPFVCYPTSIIPLGENYLVGFYSSHSSYKNEMQLRIIDGEGRLQRAWEIVDSSAFPEYTFAGNMRMEILRTEHDAYLLIANENNFIIYAVQLRDETPPDPLTATPADIFWYGSYDYCLEDGKVTILRYSGGDEDLIIPDSIHGFSVTKIGEKAFQKCTSIRRVTIPEGVATIGKYAFRGTPLEEIVLPNSLTAIGEEAFSNTNLSKAAIPASVADIGANPFSECENLSRIDVSKENPAYKSDGGVLYAEHPQVLISFPPKHAKKTYKILKGTLEIGDFAFAACVRLTGVTLPDSLISIGNGAFEGCEQLKSISIPNGVTSVGSWAFSECASLKNVSLSGIAVIREGMFYDCAKLAELTIPNGVTTIEHTAFDGCVNLTRLTIPSSVTSIPDYEFKEYDFPKLTFYVTVGSYAEEYAQYYEIPYKRFTEKNGNKPPKPVDTPPPVIDDDDWFPNPAYEDGGWFGASDDDDAYGYQEAEVFPGMFVGEECWEAIPATLNQRMATRTGPGTKFTEDHGTLPQDTEIVVYAKEAGGSATWVLVEFVKNGKLVRAYTGLKRIDADADSIAAAEDPESATVTVDTTAFYGPGKGYLELKGQVKKGTKVQVYGIDKGFALIEYAVGNAWTRSWVPEETLAIEYK